MEAERDVLLAAQRVAASAPAAMLLDIKGIGPEFAAILWSEGNFLALRQSTPDRLLCGAGLRHPGRVDRLIANRACLKQAIRDCEQRSSTRVAMAAPSAALGAGPAVQERVRRNGGRLKKTTIVALARKLLVALWKYVTAGVVIEGAVMKRT